MSEATQSSVRARFELAGRVVIITGGAGLLGEKHGEAVAEMGGIPVLVDVDGERARDRAAAIARTYPATVLGLQADVTHRASVEAVLHQVLGDLGRVDGLVNNAARNPKVEARDTAAPWSRLESFPIDVWDGDIAVGLTGALICSQVFGGEMARRGRGVILNIASDLGIIAPDQRLYRQPGLPDEQQPVKPVTYSVVKHGLIGLTRYLATYWADRGVRVNALSPGGVANGQDEEFVRRLANLIPMGRMADQNEYKAAVAFLLSDASSYMTGANLVMDGGRTVW